MRIIDLSIPIHQEMLQIGKKLYPGGPAPFVMEPVMTHEKDGFLSTKVTMYTHVGTHIDAPIHFVNEGRTIDQLSLEMLVGRAVTLDLRDKGENEPLDREDLQAAEAALPPGIAIEAGRPVLLCTGWLDKTWGSFDFWEKSPYLTERGAQWLVSKNVSAAGYDFFQEAEWYAHSKETIPPSAFKIHRLLLSAGVLNIEYLTNLREIVGMSVFLVASPIKILRGDGAPARVIAIVDF
ncbi:MAG: hypothetical protein CMO12_04635 [Thaumarchaeota archaeon]|nr:hypothetical protein [Nitrososphaerota archaeon]